MADYVLQNCKLYVAQYDLSGDMNRVSLTATADVLDKTPFGSAARTKAPGLRDMTAEHEGFWQGGANAVDDVLFARVGAANAPFTVAPADGTAGETAYFTRALHASYKPGGQVGQMLAFAVSAEGHDALVRGTVMLNGAIAATATGTARQLGAVSATQKLYAAMHVLAASGAAPTLDMVVQSDDAQGFTTPTARITFTQATAVGAEWATPVAGAITDDWWRLSYTIGGAGPSFTVVVLVGIQ